MEGITTMRRFSRSLIGKKVEIQKTILKGYTKSGVPEWARTVIAGRVLRVRELSILLLEDETPESDEQLFGSVKESDRYKEWQKKIPIEFSLCDFIEKGDELKIIPEVE